MGRKAEQRERRKKKRQSGAAAADAAADEVELDLTDLASLIPEPPREPATRMRSGFAPRLPDARDANDKVDIDVEDLSLRPDNPYVASPLLSAPAEEEPTVSPAARAAKLAVIVLVAATSAYGAWAAIRDLSSSERPRVERDESAPALARVTPPRTEPASDRAPSTALAAVTSARPAPEITPRITHDAPETPAATPARTRVANAAPKRAPALAVPMRAQPAPPETAPANERQALTQATVAAVAPRAASTEPLPKRPSHDALKSSFDAIKPLLRACVPGRQGLVTIHTTIRSQGRIWQGTVEGVAQTPDERACMTRAILALRFPPFTQDVLTVSFPLAL